MHRRIRSACPLRPETADRQSALRPRRDQAFVEASGSASE